ncbi:hypothetical protein VTN49DRAFT_1984 [Thermomyces lanuginosus]|uniref:uncharacterized protein n=1 Tax=Thermomyces lanuginosus TaxID=5541 RepID=UPI0037445A1A
MHFGGPARVLDTFRGWMRRNLFTISGQRLALWRFLRGVAASHSTPERQCAWYCKEEMKEELAISLQ